MSLDPDEAQRYARHLVLKGMGGAGQQKLKAAKVLVLGAGGLGSPVIAYLAAAGVGTIGVIDDDIVSLSNLQRQIVHGEADIGRTKVQSAENFVAGLNSETTFHSHQIRADEANLPGIFVGYDLAIDGSDNFAARSAMAKAAAFTGRALISGAVSMFDGQVTVFAPGPGNPGFFDLYPEAPEEADLPSCETVGILGPVTGIIGTLMAMEAIKLLTGIGEPLVGRLLLYDGRAAKFTELAYDRQK